MAIRGQPDNIDYASPTQFQLTINQLPEVQFFVNSLTLPGVNMGETVIPTPLKQIPTMGDEITFENLTLSFLVNETFDNYMEIHNWLMAIGFPQSNSQFSDFRANQSVTPSTTLGKTTDIGQTSKAILGNSGVFYIYLEKLNIAQDLPSYLSFSTNLSGSKTNNLNTKVYEALKDISEVVDNRSLFY